MDLLHKEKDMVLKQIANHLLMNVNGLDDIGLFRGKIGIMLFFAHYGIYSANNIYIVFSRDLYDDVCESISESTPINFGSGLSGIGWSLSYLYKKSMIDDDLEEILRDVDKKIMEYDLSRIDDKSLENGVLGISCYIKSRIELGLISTFDISYLNKLDELKNFCDVPSIDILMRKLIDHNKDVSFCSLKDLGLVSGYAGLGLNLMLS